MSTAESTFDFEHAGRKFRASIYPDDSTPPWEHGDGMGIVSEWESRSKRPGELILNGHRDSTKRYYDLSGTIKKARQEGWGLDAVHMEKLRVRLGREPTRKEITRYAVDLDFQMMRSWCRDEWWYVGVAVQALDNEGRTIGGQFEHALWGIESYSEDYHKEVAKELAADWLHAAPAIEKLRPFVTGEDNKLPVLDLARLVYERVQEASK